MMIRIDYIISCLVVVHINVILEYVATDLKQLILAYLFT